MNLLIIEDEVPAFRKLQKSLESIDPTIEILDVIDSVEDSVKWLKNHEHPELILMDIQLSDGISFEIFEKVEITSPIIFTTAYDEYMLNAFRVNSIDYLLKPVKMEDLERSLQKFKKLHNGQLRSPLSPDIQSLLQEIKNPGKKFISRFLIKKGDKLLSLEVNDCAFFFVSRGVVLAITMDDKKYIIDKTLDQIVEKLDPDKFYRANRQYVVNYEAISSASKYFKGKILLELRIPHAEDVIISAEKATDFKNWFGNH